MLTSAVIQTTKGLLKDIEVAGIQRGMLSEIGNNFETYEKNCVVYTNICKKNVEI